jgi:hypothetical protein
MKTPSLTLSSVWGFPAIGISILSDNDGILSTTTAVLEGV